MWQRDKLTTLAILGLRPKVLTDDGTWMCCVYLKVFNKQGIAEGVQQAGVEAAPTLLQGCMLPKILNHDRVWGRQCALCSFRIFLNHASYVDAFVQAGLQLHDRTRKHQLSRLRSHCTDCYGACTHIDINRSREPHMCTCPSPKAGLEAAQTIFNTGLISIEPLLTASLYSNRSFTP